MKPLVLLVLLVCMSACTQTTIKQPFPDKISKEREIESRVQIALIYLEQDDPERALFELDEAMKADRKSPRVHEVLALVLERTEDFDRSEKHFRQMLRFDPDYTRGRANYAAYLLRRGECKAAYPHFQKVVEDIYYPRRAIVYQQLAYCAGQMGNHEEMLTGYRRAIALDNRMPRPYLELARIAFDNKQYPESQRYLEQYRERVEKSSAEALLLGVRLADIFKDRDAKASYLLVLKNLYPRSPEYLEYLQEQEK